MALTLDPVTPDFVAVAGGIDITRPLSPADKDAIENYESLMALTNLAGVDDSVRRRILKEQGLSNIEQYMFEEHDDLRRAATECMCNMVQCEEVSSVKPSATTHSSCSFSFSSSS